MVVVLAAVALLTVVVVMIVRPLVAPSPRRDVPGASDRLVGGTDPVDPVDIADPVEALIAERRAAIAAGRCPACDSVRDPSAVRCPRCATPFERRDELHEEAQP
jgi:hypothetical protein